MNPQVGSINFSKAIGLKEVVFRFNEIGDVWTAMALKTLTSEHTHLQKVSIHTPIDGSVREATRDDIYERWMDLDCVLVKLWESNGIDTQVFYSTDQEEGAHEYMCGLLPEAMKRGIFGMMYGSNFD